MPAIRMIGTAFLAIVALACTDQSAPTPSSPLLDPVSAGTMAPAALAEGVFHATIRERLSDVFESPCTGELIPFTARRFEEINVNTQSVEVTESIIGSGTADVTGIHYLVNDVSHFGFQMPQASGSKSNLFDMPHTIKIIGQGGGQNFLEHVVFHMTVLPSGEVRTTVDFDKAECRA
jgi:hypothetical protein